MKVKEFSEIVQGTIIGDPEIEITGVAGIKEAEEGDISFIASSKYLKYLPGSKASCIIVKEPVEGVTATQVIVGNPHYAFARALECFYPGPTFEPGISDQAVVSEKSVMGKDVTIFPFAYISDHVSIGDETVIFPGVVIGEGAKIGSRCIIHPNVSIRENVRIGDRVIIHSGTVIGSDGFGYVFEKGIHYKIPQVGAVVIEDDVEIGANVSIDRATTGNTVIGKGTKIDNLVQIAHNVKIGEKSLIIAQVGISGSSEIGSFVTVAGQAGIADHATIESGTIIGAQSGIMGHLKKGVYSGSPAIAHRDWLKAQVLFAKLPEIQKKIKEIEGRLNKVEKEDSRL
jgi:UDP-3-O-[3-hydroxymyristoyl] glucosamine N-acyltransferase